MNRREMLLQSIPATAGIRLLPFSAKANTSDEELIAQIGLIREMDNDSFGWIWSILKGVTNEELDWKINEESNSIRWIEIVTITRTNEDKI